MQGIFISAVSLFLSAWNYDQLNVYLVSKLFKAPDVTLSPSNSAQIREFCFDRLLPSRLVCCKKRRKQVVMEKALRELKKQVDVIKMIRSRRFVDLALRYLLDNAVRIELKKRSKYEEINS